MEESILVTCIHRSLGCGNAAALGCGQVEWHFVEELYQCIITIGKMVSIFCALESYSTFTGHLKSNSIVYYWHVLMFPNR